MSQRPRYSITTPPAVALFFSPFLTAAAVSEPSPRRKPWVNGQAITETPAGVKEGWIRQVAAVRVPIVTGGTRIARPPACHDSIAAAAAFCSLCILTHGLRRGLESGRRYRGCTRKVESSVAGPREGVGSLSRHRFSKWRITDAKDSRPPCAAPVFAWIHEKGWRPIERSSYNRRYG